MKTAENDSPPPFGQSERDAIAELQRKRQKVANAKLFQETIDAIDDLILILNQKRQIVGANKATLKTLNRQMDDVLGKRPGELLGCKNAAAAPDGCGTAAGCIMCGTLEAILTSQQTDKRVTRECRISMQEPIGDSLDLKVNATPVLLDDERFTIWVLTDISAQKRLAVLSRIFFHDVMNTAGGIHGYVQLIRETVGDSVAVTDLTQLSELADHLVDEIQAQRDLTYAESGELHPVFSSSHGPDILQRVLSVYAGHTLARQREIRLGTVWEGQIVTDATLLARVIGNMVKNALEATPPGGVVTLSCVEQGKDVVFNVHNQSVMPNEVQLQVFQRSFSTKASSGRGIGTHSMKLIGERYLGGKVNFVSREPEGTTFFIKLPKVYLGGT